MFLSVIFALSSIFLLNACSIHTQLESKQQREKQLYTLITKTNKQIDHAEANILAHEAVRYSRKLSKEYKTTTSPLMHNFLVNVGIKARGLCYQWADDLYLHLEKFHLKSIVLEPVGAYVGSYWREHNALALLPSNDRKFKNAILLDAWRNSGELYFTPINSDPEYSWQIRKDRCAVYRHSK